MGEREQGGKGEREHVTRSAPPLLPCPSENNLRKVTRCLEMREYDKNLLRFKILSVARDLTRASRSIILSIKWRSNPTGGIHD
jgi:hypothetical protein